MCYHKKYSVLVQTIKRNCCTFDIRFDCGNNHDSANERGFLKSINLNCFLFSSCYFAPATLNTSQLERDKKHKEWIKTTIA